jgi:hypothetical protein
MPPMVIHNETEVTPRFFRLACDDRQRERDALYCDLLAALH